MDINLIGELTKVVERKTDALLGVCKDISLEVNMETKHFEWTIM